ncbi:MAG: DUF805 domain-containing protein [Desulfovibrionaceae bacterium]|nr:DUF805 domain-containing protein [Desulfovibrionaceae bacterium]
MDFITSIKTCILEKPFTFSGRASRSEYWWFYLFVSLLNLILSGTGAIGAIINFSLTVPMIFVSCRRLHDSNLSGWFQLLPLAIALLPLLLFSELSTEFLAIFFVVAFSLSIYLYCRKGTPGPNRFGDNPLTQKNQCQRKN